MEVGWTGARFESIEKRAGILMFQSWLMGSPNPLSAEGPNPIHTVTSRNFSCREILFFLVLISIPLSYAFQSFVMRPVNHFIFFFWKYPKNATTPSPSLRNDAPTTRHTHPNTCRTASNNSSRLIDNYTLIMTPVQNHKINGTKALGDVDAVLGLWRQHALEQF